MKILITGASGFVGKHLVSSLAEKHQVYAMIRKGEAVDGRAQVIRGDLLDLSAIERIFTNPEYKEIELIIHTASILADAANLDDINVLNSNNILNHNIAQVAKRINCKRLINFSSSSVYPNVDGKFDEGAIADPAQNRDAYYGLSKLNGEVILNAQLLEKDILITHLRFAMIYGTGVNKSRIWPVMEQELEHYNTITVFGEGKRLINQIHIDDLTKILDRVIEKKLSGIFNLKAETLSMLDLAKRIVAEKGNEDSRIILENKGSTLQFELDCTKWDSIA